MKKSLKCVLALGVMLPVFCGSMNAQELELRRSVVGSGGTVGATTQGGEYTLSAIAGQTAIEKRESDGLVEGMKLDLYQGFWINTGETSSVDGGNPVVSDNSITIGPNPFNANNGTEIKFNLPGYAEVEVNVYDLLGNKIDNVFIGSHSAGSFSTRWEPQTALNSGSYVCEVIARPAGSSTFKQFRLFGKMILAK